MHYVSLDIIFESAMSDVRIVVLDGAQVTPHFLPEARCGSCCKSISQAQGVGRWTLVLSIAHCSNGWGDGSFRLGSNCLRKALWVVITTLFLVWCKLKASCAMRLLEGGRIVGTSHICSSA